MEFHTWMPKAVCFINKYTFYLLMARLFKNLFNKFISEDKNAVKESQIELKGKEGRNINKWIPLWTAMFQ